MTVDSMLLATPSPLSLGGRLRAVGLGCDGEPAVVVDVRDRRELPPAPDNRTDLVAMGRWVEDCLDAENRLVWRTVVRHLVDELEVLHGRSGR